MKAFILLTVLAVASANPQIIYNGWPFGGIQYPGVTYSAVAAPTVTYSAAPAAFTYTSPALTYAPIATKTQYHAQDELGQASYGYSHPGHAHAAVRDAFGGVKGSYAYINPNGKEVRVNYVADSVNGFRVESNDLPVGPAVPVAPVLVGPSPVQDTPEVAEAKAAHAKAVEEAIARNAEADKNDAAEATAEEEVKKPEEKVEEKAPVVSRRKRGVVTTYAAAPIFHSAPTFLAGGHHVVAPVTYTAAVPALTYAAAPPVTYSAAHVVAAAPAVRVATLTKIVNTPGHAVSYRVD